MKLDSLFPTLILAAALTSVTGCGDGHRHDHDHDHDHDHAHDDGTSDGHRHASPHGGVAIALGDHQFHLDVLADTHTGTLKAWILDAHAENFVRIAASNLAVTVLAPGRTSVVTLVAQANPATGETVGATSHFQGNSEDLRDLPRFDGVVPSLEIRGTTFRDIRFAYPEATRP